MTELSKHIGPDTDVPGRGSWCWGREIGYLFDSTRDLKNECYEGVLTERALNSVDLS